MPITAILGIDGSGKSTIAVKTAERLSAGSPVYLVSDRLFLYRDGRPIPFKLPLAEKVREKIGSYAKNARSLKRYKLPKLTELLLRNHIIRGVEKKRHPPFLVLDGAPVLNLVAWARLYKEKEFTPAACCQTLRILTGHASLVDRADPVYRSFPELAWLKKLGFTRFVLPDRVVFLDVSPETALERISGRGKKLQVHETVGKLGSLRQAYLVVCAVLKEHFPVHTSVINGNGPLDQVIGTVHRFIQEKASCGSPD